MLQFYTVARIQVKRGAEENIVSGHFILLNQRQTLTSVCASVST